MEELLSKLCGVRPYFIGCIYLLLISVLWTLASFLVQFMRDDDSVDFNSPFFLTCYCTNLFMVFVPISEWKLIFSFVVHKISSLFPFRCFPSSSSSLPQHQQQSAPSSSPAPPRPSPEFLLAIPLSILWFAANYLYAFSLTLTSLTSSTILATLGSVFAYLFSVVVLGVESDSADDLDSPAAAAAAAAATPSGATDLSAVGPPFSRQPQHPSSSRPGHSPSQQSQQSFILASLGGSGGDLRHLDVAYDGLEMDGDADTEQSRSLLYKGVGEDEEEGDGDLDSLSKNKMKNVVSSAHRSGMPPSILKGGKRARNSNAAESNTDDKSPTTSLLPPSSSFRTGSAPTSQERSSSTLSTETTLMSKISRQLFRRRKLLGVILTFGGGILVALLDFEDEGKQGTDETANSTATKIEADYYYGTNATTGGVFSTASDYAASSSSSDSTSSSSSSLFRSSLFGDIAGFLSAAGYGAYTTYIKAVTRRPLPASESAENFNPDDGFSVKELFNHVLQTPDDKDREGGGGGGVAMKHARGGGTRSQRAPGRPVSVRLLLGYVGVVNFLLFTSLLYPLLLVSDLTPRLSSLHLTSAVLSLLTLKGLLDNVLSDYLWARAVVLCGPTAASIGLGLTVPLAVALDVIAGKFDGETPPIVIGKIAGAAAVLAGFGAVNYGQGG